MSPRRIRGVALCGLVLSLSSLSQEAPVQVQYVHAENFADVGNRRFSDERIRAAYLEQLRGHLAGRAAALLGAGERLSVSITELDMAGEFEAWRPPLGDTRMEGARRLLDPAFLLGANRYSDDPLRYEKALTDRWLEQELKGR